MRAEQREALARRVLDLSPAPSTEVTIFERDTSLSRFTHNSIHQNVAEHDLSVRIRAIDGKRQGVVSCNSVGDADLRRAAERALEIARLSPEDPELVPLVSKGIYVPPSDAYVEATAQTGAQRRAELADAIFVQMEHHRQWAAGFVTTSSNGVTLANSAGLSASFDATDSGINVKANAADSTGFAEAYVHDQRTLDGAALGLRAAEKASRSANPRSVDVGDWTVIMEPPAFGEFLSYLASHFGAQAYVDGSSFLSDGLNRAYAGENVTIRDDYRHPLVRGMPFDYEGQPTTPLALIERGVAKHVVTDAYYAKRLGVENTGHALPPPNAYGPRPRCLLLEPGTKTREQLIAETKRGLLITRLWYIRPVDQRRTVVTGMTRDGTFLIEEGRIIGGVRNMRFNQSIVGALLRCEAADDLVRTGGYSYETVVPTVKIEGFHFSSGTDF